MTVESVPMTERTSEHVQSLERGLAVIKTFSRVRHPLTLTEVAERAGLAKAVARRLLMTLEHLGYVGRDGRNFSLLPKALELGYSYLSSLPLNEVLNPRLSALASRFEEAASAAVLDGDRSVYIARVTSGRVVTIGLAVGDRLPAYATSVGQVLLADLPDDELDHYLDTSVRKRMTDRTLVDRDELRERLMLVRKRGWALVDGELEAGVCAVAAPVRGADGRAVAAVKVGGQNTHSSAERMVNEICPVLLATVADISHDLAMKS